MIRSLLQHMLGRTGSLRPQSSRSFITSRLSYLDMDALAAQFGTQSTSSSPGQYPATPLSPKDVKEPVASTPAAKSKPLVPVTDLSKSLNDAPITPDSATDWTKSFQGFGDAAFSPEIADILMKDLDSQDVEIKPDGILYLPEIKYRRIMNKAFGPGGWGLAPRSETIISPKTVSREYGLICQGRLVSVARGEQTYFDVENIPTATEGCKSNALMRCCKDLGVASELWDPSFIRMFKKKYCDEQFVEHIPSKRKRKLWKRKDVTWEYPYKLS
ncbi:mitochondrial genome maintenance MGM101-domain-containing protein [Lipomyces oligophaga]|uniref:mitochondrial genome maintenance MGM101-domain-containing protein n=1 Tax=Lipomyces oligophaga TaxID=45792 RepID=UPI0034D00459